MSPNKIVTLETKWPKIYRQLLEIKCKLEEYYKDVCDIEFCIENGKLFILQARPAKRTHIANLRFALQFFNEGKINLRETVSRIGLKDLQECVKPELINKEKLKRLGVGFAASRGIATGKIVTSARLAHEMSSAGEDIILARAEFSPDDIDGMARARGILSSRGKLTSHAAIVCRGWGKPCVNGFDMDIDYNLGEVCIRHHGFLKKDEYITIKVEYQGAIDASLLRGHHLVIRISQERCWLELDICNSVTHIKTLLAVSIGHTIHG